MPIPENITAEHIQLAMIRYQNEGPPVRRGLRRWAVYHNEHLFPCKLLISWGNVFANGDELDPNPNNFQADMAKKYLGNLGFQIVDLHLNIPLNN